MGRAACVLALIAACGGRQAVDPSVDAGATDASADASMIVDAATRDAGPDVDSATVVDASTGAPKYVDISVGQGAKSGYNPSAVIDSANGKLLVVTADSSGGSVRPSLFRCNLDGTACTYSNISAGLIGTGYNPSAIIDVANGKLLAVTAGQPTLFRCNLDGTACTSVLLGQGMGYHYNPSAVIDAVNAKLLVVASSNTLGGRVALVRCNLDGTSCAYADISAGQGMFSGSTPSAAIDTANGKLLVVTNNESNNTFIPSLFRCNLDGTSCTHTDLGGGQGFAKCFDPSVVIDAANGKLLVVAQDRSINVSFKPHLFRCNLDGTACSDIDISAGQGAGSGYYPSAVIDSAHGKLIVATQNAANQGRPSAFSCNLDGTACVHRDISDGQGYNSGAWPSAVIDTKGNKLLVVTTNESTSLTPALFMLGL